MLNKIWDYVLLIIVGISLLIGYFIFEAICKYIGITGSFFSLTWLWITTIVASAYASFTTKKYKKQILKVKFILMSNAILLTTLYSLILFYLNKIGYNVIPTLAIQILFHGLALLYVIFLINEQILKRISKNRTRNIPYTDDKPIH